jgi:hypothetical protein
MDQPISPDSAVEAAKGVLSWTDVDERECLAALAREVRPGGLILEIGSLYGGTAAVMALANPAAKIVCIDEFSWTPRGYPEPSAQMLLLNMDRLNIHNVKCLAQPSEKVLPRWQTPIDLLWVDGGHSYEFVHADLVGFGPYAKVIAAHDYKNPGWPSVTKAIDEFADGQTSAFRIVQSVNTVAVMRRAE